MAQVSERPAVRPDQARHDGYRVTIEPVHQRIRAVVRGVTIAESSGVLVMRETRLPLVYYFPRDDVRMDQLVRSDHRTNCPFKGNASYWKLKIGDRLEQNAAWSYEDPFDESLIVKGYLAFDRRVIDAWYADDTEIEESTDDAAPAEANPFIGWLVENAWQADSSRSLVARLAQTLVDAGLPLWRLRLAIQTLHPQLAAFTYTWQQGEDEISVFQATHAGVQRAQFTESPFALIMNGEGGVRRRLEGKNPKLDFPILNDLRKEGATDYVAVPLRFSDGQINVLVLVSDEPGGFSTGELGQLYEILPNLSRLFEAHSLRVSSVTLLQTYLGRNAGKRVMDGLVKRGDGEELHAVIWFSDLRGSTKLADTLSREDYLAALDQYFDCVAGAVIEHDGEVLKFIGDAVLAIFEIDDPDSPDPDACKNALEAICDAQDRIESINRERQMEGKPQLRFGTGLHRGNLTYGNIGTTNRLDFTVIGPAVNEASRIEALCKTLDQSVLASEAFAAGVSRGLKSLGHYALRGVRDEQEIFAIVSD